MFVIVKSCFCFEKLACVWARCCICYCKELILFVLFCFVGDFNLPSSGQGVVFVIVKSYLICLFFLSVILTCLRLGKVLFVIVKN